jgi:hypothetical protein
MICKSFPKFFHMKKWKGWKNESQSFYKTISLHIFAPKDRVELYPSLIGGQWPNDDLVN